MDQPPKMRLSLGSLHFFWSSLEYQLRRLHRWRHTYGLPQISLSASECCWLRYGLWVLLSPGCHLSWSPVLISSAQLKVGIGSQNIVILNPVMAILQLSRGLTDKFVNKPSYDLPVAGSGQ